MLSATPALWMTDSGSDIHQEGGGPLMQAAKFLVGRACYTGARPNLSLEAPAPDERATLLHLAAEYGNLEAAKLLLNRGADAKACALPEEFGIGGQTPIFHAIPQFYDGGLTVKVSQRTREIGVRIALGAQLPTLRRMFVRQGMLLTSIGVVAGLFVSFGVMRLMSSLFFGVKAMDPVTCIAVSCGLAATAFLACYLPSRRAAGVDPVETLRPE